ncbi:unnamed protein product [Protopolystoma xenopodis]|uniref:Uncharacterized protein n=1 Tax=Protopolystoma xenopodis TaxID=117903 RepID=A0A448WFU4_9PLAT|nr:unnamed protein product [Protopolystoma xenopodis]
MAQARLTAFANDHLARAVYLLTSLDIAQLTSPVQSSPAATNLLDPLRRGHLLARLLELGARLDSVSLAISSSRPSSPSDESVRRRLEVGYQLACFSAFWVCLIFGSRSPEFAWKLVQLHDCSLNGGPASNGADKAERNLKEAAAVQTETVSVVGFGEARLQTANAGGDEQHEAGSGRHSIGDKLSAQKDFESFQFDDVHRWSRSEIRDRIIFLINLHYGRLEADRVLATFLCPC